MTPSAPPPLPPSPPRPRPAALEARNQVIAVLAVLLAAAVPLALAFGVDVCAPLVAVGIELDACAFHPTAEPALPPEPVAPASPGAHGDGGAE